MTAEHTEPPVAFTKARVAEIGNAWMTYAKSQIEWAKEKAPPPIKSLLKMERKSGAGSQGQASTEGNSPTA